MYGILSNYITKLHFPNKKKIINNLNCWWSSNINVCLPWAGAPPPQCGRDRGLLLRSHEWWGLQLSVRLYVQVHRLLHSDWQTQDIFIIVIISIIMIIYFSLHPFGGFKIFLHSNISKQNNKYKNCFTREDKNGISCCTITGLVAVWSQHVTIILLRNS